VINKDGGFQALRRNKKNWNIQHVAGVKRFPYSKEQKSDCSPRPLDKNTEDEFLQ